MGYIVLLLAFVAMVAGCFAFAIMELRHPQDPGPLPIDVKRDIADRHFAQALRTGWGESSYRQTPGIEFEGTDVAVEVRGSLSVADDEDHPAAYVVRGNGKLGAGSQADAFVCDGVAVIGAGALVVSHAEGATALVVGPGARIDGRATSGGVVRLAPGVSLRFASAPVIVTDGPRSDGTLVPSREWTEDAEAHLDRLLLASTPLDWALRELSWQTDTDAAPLSGVQALARAEKREGVGELFGAAAQALARSWSSSGKAWYLGASTVRVRGDLTLPEGSWVPFHLVVEGTLRAGAGVRFQGSVHTWGDALLGRGCAVEGSLTSRGEVSLAEGTWVSGCLSGAKDVCLGAGSTVGNGRSGGVSANGKLRLGPGVLVRGKLYADGGATVDEPVTTVADSEMAFAAI